MVIVGAFSIIGLIAIVVAIALTALLMRAAPRGGAVGLMAGLGLPLLYVGYLNRGGPGNVCHALRGGESCTDELSPWPWVVAGCLLIAGAIGLHSRARRGPRA